jgi:hypothetical protein
MVMKHSNVWFWFYPCPDDKEYAVCIFDYCKTQPKKGRVKLNNGGTTNLKSHLLQVHKIDCEKDCKKESKQETNSTIENFGIELLPPQNPNLNTGELAEAWIEGGPISKETARGWRFKKHFSQCLPTPFNDKVITNLISKQALVRDKEISTRLKEKRTSLLMDGWSRHEKDIFNIIVGGDYILSTEMKSKETIENVVEKFTPIIQQIEKERGCLIFNICTDHTNKAKSPLNYYVLLNLE